MFNSTITSLSWLSSLWGAT